VWDMFGITFAGHPDHRRILLPDEFAAFPLRKDYPLQGRGERHNFPVLTRDEA
jgi:NADH-quinone oxidoreductase subunit C